MKLFGFGVREGLHGSRGKALNPLFYPLCVHVQGLPVALSTFKLNGKEDHVCTGRVNGSACAMYVSLLQWVSRGQVRKLMLWLLWMLLLDLPLKCPTEIGANRQQQHFPLTGEMKDAESNFR